MRPFFAFGGNTNPSKQKTGFQHKLKAGELMAFFTNFTKRRNCLLFPVLLIFQTPYQLILFKYISS